MIISIQKITILSELQEYIIPPSREEFDLLEKSILAEGCREALIVWEKSKGKLVLVDGHNRYKICQKHGIEYRVKKRSFENLDSAKIWMVENQIGRRNLTPDQLSYYRGLKYVTLRKKKGGYASVLGKGQVVPSTSEMLSNDFNVSSSTIKRDAKFAEGLDIIGLSNPKLRLQILMGTSKAKKADVQTLANAKNPQKLVIKNEADLYNKAKLINSEIVGEIEARVKKVSEERVEKARQVLKELEPVFTNKEDRLKRLKGMIVSAINKAINEKDEKAIAELKKLIDRLAEEIFY